MGAGESTDVAEGRSVEHSEGRVGATTAHQAFRDGDGVSILSLEFHAVIELTDSTNERPS